MKLAVVFLLLVIVKIGSTDTTRLREWQKGMDNFDLHKSMGKWYLYAIEQPCTWKGGNAFKDWTYTFSPDPHGFTVEEKWSISTGSRLLAASNKTCNIVHTRKDGSCTTTKAKVTSTISPAVFKVVDQIGDLWSGTLVSMCTDYTNYAITWGCVKQSVHPGMCDDYMFGVRTRKPNISQKYVDEINQKLHQLWGISLSDTVLVPHNTPCDQPIQRPGRMFKTKTIETNV